MYGLLKRIALLIALCLVAGSARGTIVTLNSGLLPYTASTANDTLTWDGTLTSATNGINVTASGVHILPGALTDSLIFGTGGGSGNYAIRIAGAACSVKYGYYVTHSSATGASVVNNAANVGAKIDSVFLVVNGDNSHGISYPSGSFFNFYIYGSTVYNLTTGFTSRHTFDGAIVYGQTNPSTSYSSTNKYNGKIRKCRFINARMGTELRGCWQMDSSTVIIDMTNSLVSTQTGNPYCIYMRSFRNGYAASASDTTNRGYVRACSLLAGTTYFGGRGIHMQGGSQGTSTVPIEIAYNVIKGHVGNINDGNNWHAFRPENESGGAIKHAWIHDNYIDGSVDNNSSTYRGQQAYGMFSNFASTDSNVLVEHNTFRLWSSDNSGRILQAFMDGAGNPLSGRVIWRYNIVMTGGTVYGHGSDGNFNNAQVLYSADTVRKLPSDSQITVGNGSQCNSSVCGSTYNPFLSVLGRWDGTNSSTAYDTGVHIRDLTILGGGFNEKTSWASEFVQSAEKRGVLERTLTVNVKSGGENVNGATVKVYDNLSVLRWQKSTDGTGNAIDTAQYWQWRRILSTTPDTTGWNPFTVIASLGADADTGTITLGHGLTQTLNLSLGGAPVADTSIALVSDASAGEGQVIYFRVSLDPTRTEATTFTVNVGDGTGLAGTDYADTSYTATIPVDSMGVNVGIRTLNDDVRTGNKTLILTLSNLNSANVVFQDSVATGTKLEDDAPRKTKF